jgi:ribose 5-phosphate isomerase B
MARPLVSEAEVRALISTGGKRLEVPAGAMVTVLAREVAEANGIEIVEASVSPRTNTPEPAKSQSPVSQSEPSAVKTVVFGSDHGGYQLKEQLKKFTESLGYTVTDVGTHSEEACDYPDFAYAVAKTVADGVAWRGVMIDGAGIGSCIVANKVPGIRAACGSGEFTARNAREHNDTNVLTLGSRVTGIEVCKEILRVWLESWFSGGRHRVRVDKIIDVERKFLR